MKKKRFIIVIVILLVWISMFSVDLKRVKEGINPIFTVHYNHKFRNYYVGLFYVYKQDFTIAPSQPFNTSPHVEIAPWLLPGIEVYSASNI